MMKHFKGSANGASLDPFPWDMELPEAEDEEGQDNAIDITIQAVPVK